MIEEPIIAHSAALLTAVIPFKIPRSEIQKVMSTGLSKILAAVAAQDIGPAGPWFNQHFKLHPATFDFEISVPISAPVKPVGRVQPSQLPAIKVARTVYRGPYDGLEAAWGEFDAWIKAHGQQAAPSLWEVYVTGPESGPDPAQWRTQFNRPLIG